MKYFPAPWSSSLIVISLSAVAVLAIGSAMAARETHSVVPLLALGILFGAALFTIRGYTILKDVILVHRLLWVTRLPRGPVHGAVFDPQALRSSLKIFGNGGLLSFTGLYWNRRLGFYRAFVTNPKRAVILRYPDRTVVVSPEPPQEFMRALGWGA